jgi:hypothetical protein
LAVRETVLGRLSVDSGRIFLDDMQLDAAALASIDRIPRDRDWWWLRRQAT